jgi:hypothetical protein
VKELSRRDSPKWHIRLAVDHVNCLPKTLFLVLYSITVVDVLAGLFSHQWERVATPTIYTRPRENTATRDATPVELMMKRERSRPKGMAGKVHVLDELQIISCKRLTSVRRCGWL